MPITDGLVKRRGSVIKVKIWAFLMSCYKCHKQVEVLWPEDIDLELVAEHLACRGHSQIKRVFSHTMGEEVWGNICPHCGAYQGNFFVSDAYLDMRNEQPTLMEYPKVIEVIDVDFPCAECGKRSGDVTAIMADYLLCSDCYAKLMKEMAERRERDREDKKRRLETESVECPICGRRVLPESMTNHHAMGPPERRIRMCMSCNRKIHRSTDYHPELK